MNPDLSGPDGRPLPIFVRALRQAFVRGTPGTRRVARHIAWRTRLHERLPEMEASFSDGRKFLIPRGDGNYSEIFTHGEYEPASTRLVQALLSPGDFAI